MSIFRNKLSKLSLIIFFLVLFLSVETRAANAYTLLILDFRGSAEVERWRPFAQYLSYELGKPVELHSVKPSGMFFRAKDADIVLTNPVLAVQILDNYEFEVIGTQIHRQLGARFSGVIITQKDSPIHSLTALAGKRVGVVHLKNAAGGFLFQAKELLDKGLVPEVDFRNFEVIQNQDLILKMVNRKHLDGGFIRTGQLENFKEKGGDITNIRILNEIQDEPGFPRSTDTYPHWGLLVNNKTIPKTDRETIKTAALQLDKNSTVCKIANIKGFSPPGDYDKLRRVMKELKVYEFKH